MDLEITDIDMALTEGFPVIAWISRQERSRS